MDLAHPTSPPFRDSNGHGAQQPNEEASTSWYSGAGADIGDDDIPTHPAYRVQGITGPVGEPGLPPARQVPLPRLEGPYRRDDNLRPLPQYPQSYMAPANRRFQTASVGTVDGSQDGSYRPSSSDTRSHVPSLTSRAFLTPLSSQRLQAHRGQRPWSMQDSSPRLDEFDDAKSITNRNSTGSVLTIRGGHALPTQYDIETMPSVSRASHRTDYTEGESDYADFVAGGAVMQGQEEASQEQTGQGSTVPLQDDGEATYERYAPDTQHRTSSPKLNLSNLAQASGMSMGNGHQILSSRETSPRDDKFVEKQQEVKKQLGRNYEYFSGNTVFWLGGRLQNAKDRPIVIVTALIVILPVVLFFIFSAPWLWHHVSPAIPILFAYLFYICMSSFIHASVTDPGILPRNLHPLPPPDPLADPLALGPPTTDWVMVKSAVAQHGAFEVPTKFCKSCTFWRPPRCHHCRVCDNCVDTQDHHCMWLNNCVGRRNYRYFYAFVSSGTIIAIFLFAASVAHVWAWKRQHHASNHTAINANRVPFALFLYGLLAFPYPGSLWAYHTFLIARGQTTREYLNSNKFAKADRHRPFNLRPWWRNFGAVLLRPRPPTYLEFKREYEEGDQRFGERRAKSGFGWGGGVGGAGARGGDDAGTRAGGIVGGGASGGLEMRQMDGNANANSNGHATPGFQGPVALRGPLNRTPRDELDGAVTPGSRGLV